MRIRKHAKLSPLLYTSSSAQNDTVVETTVCQLNQSPWDVITFSSDEYSPPTTTPPPSPPFRHRQVEEEDSLVGNGSLCDSIGGLERVNKNNNGSNNLAREISSIESDKPIEHRGRRRQKKSRASTDPNDYYYYSGFGPRWGGKRRGRSSTNNNRNSSDDNVSHSETLNVEGGELLGSNRIECGELGYIREDEDDEEEDGGSVKKRARKPVKARSLKSL